MRRGSRLHKCLETALKSSEPSVGWLPEDQAIRGFCCSILATLQKAMNAGWEVFVEREINIDQAGKEREWFDNSGYLRCKIDVLAIPPAGSPVFIWDWKSGRTPGKRQQLELNALALAQKYGPGPYQGYFVYFDQGRVEHHTIRLPFTNLALVGEKHWAGTELAPLVRDVRALSEAWITQNWPKTPSPQACRWCEMDCEHRGRR